MTAISHIWSSWKVTPAGWPNVLCLSYSLELTDHANPQQRPGNRKKLLSARLPRPTLLKTVTAYNWRALCEICSCTLLADSFFFLFTTKHRAFVVIRCSRSVLPSHHISLQEAQLHGCKDDRIWFQSISNPSAALTFTPVTCCGPDSIRLHKIVLQA